MISKVPQYAVALLFSIQFCALYALEFAESVKAIAHRTSYILCIDGGGSKTELQIISNNGKKIKLQKNNYSSMAISAAGSNINAIGREGFIAVIRSLFENLRVEDTPVSSLINQSALVGGFAGADAQAVQNELIDIFVEYGFRQDNIVIRSDSSMASRLIANNGIILIAGTGSVCVGKYKGKEMQVGGFGRLLGDEGSGYHLGAQAIKACLEQELGYGSETALVNDLKKYFNVAHIKDLIGPFYSGEITPSTVAAIAPLIFEREHIDEVAHRIIQNAAIDLAVHLEIAISKLQMEPSVIYLFGGIFKNKKADSFIEKIRSAAHLDKWNIVNFADKNPTVCLVQKILKDT